MVRSIGSCFCYQGSICALCHSLVVLAVQLVCALMGLALGLFLFMRPEKAIETQKRFYEKINWRMEPISMEREVRTTTMMGAVLILIILAMAVAGRIGS